MKLLQTAQTKNQKTITSYFSIINEINILTKKYSELAKLLQHVQKENCDGVSSGVHISGLFSKLMANADKNCGKIPEGIRFSEVIQKFATSLFIYSGPLAYDFIQHNMPLVLPSLRTIQRSVNKKYKCISDGEFRFQELLDHLDIYQCPKVVSIGEDATRVIARIDYDSHTDRLVGFVLPVDNNGLPITDSFVATSFDAIERSFSTGRISKYAFVYMAQPLNNCAPPFILACLSSDNRFDTEDVLKRWKYIYTECEKLNIEVISFGADGDSREMKSMRVSSELLLKTSNPLLQYSPSSDLPIRTMPKAWTEWFILKHPTNIFYIQDTVHITVKMKSRLLKPSILLPMGNYTAGAHYLSIIKTTFHKGEHGIRERDLNQKDKQNYDSVLHITSSSTFQLLKDIPDGLY